MIALKVYIFYYLVSIVGILINLILNLLFTFFNLLKVKFSHFLFISSPVLSMLFTFYE